MPEQLLDAAQVRAAVEQVRREAVPERVRRDLASTPLGDRADARSPRAQPPAHVARAKRAAGLRQEQRLGGLRGRAWACAAPSTSAGRARSRYARIASIAGSPTGTKRVLRPLPSTRSCSPS